MLLDHGLIRWRASCLLNTQAPLEAAFKSPLPRCAPLPQTYTRLSSSSTRWKARQTKDAFARASKVDGLKSRAAYKLLELDSKHRLFRRGHTVVDLGYAPGSWSQVAVNRTAPGGRVVGIDVIPAQPPKGASSIQGNFLSEAVREEVRRYVRDPMRGRARKAGGLTRRDDDGEEEGEAMSEEELEQAASGYIQRERSADLGGEGEGAERTSQEEGSTEMEKSLSARELDELEGRVVDVVLSDMSAPWELTSGMWIKSVSNPYRRMMNTSGMPFRDHAGSMDLCSAALDFCESTLKTGGHFLCKFYQGAEDKAFEMRLKKLFEKVHREKPESSRSVSIMLDVLLAALLTCDRNRRKLIS